jgi:hypothetical protein
MRKLTYIAAIALAVGALAGLPSVARAQAFTFDDAYDLGYVTPPEPADPDSEENYVNTLISFAPGSGQHTVGSYTYFRKNVSCGTCPAAVFNFKDESGNNVVDLGTGGFTYLLAKYDGPNGGSEIFNVQGLTGIWTIPLNGFGKNNEQYGLSHWTLFGPGGPPPPGVPDGGTTVMLLGAALGALGMVRRYLTR